MVNVRLAKLALPLPLETAIRRALGQRERAAQHEGLVLAWELAVRIHAGSLWAVCRHVGASSPALETVSAKLVLPSTGHWVELARTCAELLHKREEPAALAFRASLDALARRLPDECGLRSLAHRIALLRGTNKAASTAREVLNDIPFYRNNAQSTHKDIGPTFREESVPALLEGLLDFCERAPLCGTFSLVFVGRLEAHGQRGGSAELARLNGAHVTWSPHEFSAATFGALHSSRPYLFQAPDLAVPLFPMAAVVPRGADWHVGWYAHEVHVPTVAYHGAGGADFQVALAAEEFERLVGGSAREFAADAAALQLEPYRGLLAYDQGHAAIFFGREEETEAALAHVAERGALFVYGASGSGKSSWLRAGVLPALRARAELVQKELVSIVMVPRDRPIAALRRALLSAYDGRDADPKRVWAQAVKDALPDTLAAISEDALARLLRRLAADGRVPVLLVDQLEEAAGVGAKAQGEARVFLSLLAAAASSAKTDGSIVLATARVDLIAALLEFGSIQSVFRSDSWPIGSIPAERLVRVVLEPLRGRKVKIASGLPEIILADVGNEPGALALLSQVLTTLWDERSRFGNALTKDGYEKAGRVSGALQRQAEAAVAEACTLDPDAEKRVFRLFRALATNVGTQGFTRRTVRLGALASELGTSTDELRAMVRPFVARHLLVLSGEIGEDTIEVAHEQLFKAWPELADVLASHREAIELRREITDAATGWDSSGRKSEFWSDETSRLRQGEEFLRDGRLDLDQLGREFLVACRARVARRRRLELAAVGVMALLALGAGWFAFDAHNARGVAEIEKQNAQAEAKRAEENEKKALAEAARALDAEAIAKRQATSTLSLRAVLQFAELEDRVDELWPATPDRLDAYESWIAEAKLLINGRSGAEADPQKRLLSLTNYEEALADLRKRARPLTAEEKELDRRKSKYFEQFLGEQKHVEAHDKLPTTPATKREFDAESKRLHEALDSLAADVNTRRTFNFDDLDDRWWNGQLSKLVTDLTNLDKAENGGLCSTGMTPTHGWGIPRRVEAARQIEEDSIIGADARKKWADAIASIRADRRFEHLELTPQFGLLPIERDPDSQLWEFAHLQTGEAPRRVDGRLKLTERTGLVFVLIPGGTTFLGAQAEEREGRNFDPQTAEFDRPPAQFALKPYFISKYEMTQAQWLRFTGHNPSYYGPQRSNKSWVNWNRDGKAWSSRHPVESVSWNDCDRVLRWLGLALPTEEQWENAARAGEPGPWYTGSDLRALRGAANLLDEPWNDLNSATQNIEPFDDGHEVHAEVGNYRANAFGLFDMCGNVSEWCEDVFGNEARAAVDGDNAGTCYRARRGGSFNDLPPAARSAYRAGYAPTTTSVEVGVRPARPVN